MGEERFGLFVRRWTCPPSLQSVKGNNPDKLSYCLNNNIQQDVVGLPDALGDLKQPAVDFKHLEHIGSVTVLGQFLYGFVIQVFHVVDQKL